MADINNDESLVEARRKLESSIAVLDSIWDGDEILGDDVVRTVEEVFCERVYAILKEFPQLARETFRYDGVQMLPFCILICDRDLYDDLELKDVYKMYPEAVSTVAYLDGDGLYPIDFAVMGRASDEIIDFVAKRTSHTTLSERAKERLWSGRSISLKKLLWLENLFDEIPIVDNIVNIAVEDRWSVDAFKYLVAKLPAQRLSVLSAQLQNFGDDHLSKIEYILPFLKEIDMLVVAGSQQKYAEQFLALLQNVSQPGSLEKVSLKAKFTGTSPAWTSRDNTEDGEGILSLHKNITHLELHHVAFRLEWLLEMFKTNTTLEEFAGRLVVPEHSMMDLNPLAEVIEKYNTTLRKAKLTICGKVKGRDKLDYWTMLNGRGRGRLRDLKTATPLTLVSALRSDERTFKHYCSYNRELDRFNADYGLLRESPGLWS